MAKVTVVGSYIVALVMDVDRIPLEGETVVGRNYHTTHGGKGSNMAACAARLGAETRFLGKIGRDAFGQGFLDLLAREGVRQDAVLVSNHVPTAVGFIVFSARGTNLIVIDMGANAEFSADDVSAHAEVVRESDVSLSPLEIPLETALAAARLADEAGRKFILNPAPATDLHAQDLRHVFALTPKVWWKGAHRGCERAEWIGTRMSFYSEHPHGLGPVIIRRSNQQEMDDAGHVRNLPQFEQYQQPNWWATDMLPEPLRHGSGHQGSHTFLTHEFIDALVHGRKRAVDVHEALAYTAPGIVAPPVGIEGRAAHEDSQFRSVVTAGERVRIRAGRGPFRNEDRHVPTSCRAPRRNLNCCARLRWGRSPESATLREFVFGAPGRRPCTGVRRTPRNARRGGDFLMRTRRQPRKNDPGC